MAVVNRLIVFLIFTSLLAGAGTFADVTLNAAHNTTVELTCSDPSSIHFPPAWIFNGSTAVTESGYTSRRDDDTGELIGTLIINGNRTFGTFNVYCALHTGKIMYNASLAIGGPLPPPENSHINESNNALVFEWNPPYSEINTNSSVVDIYPHITQYTVYIFDGNYIDKVNVTEPSFRRNITDDSSCPMYGVTAWNSGGEGDMSAPLPGSLPRIPSSIAAEDVDIRTVSGALDIRLHVTDQCTVRMPNSFLVSVMTADGVIITTDNHPHSESVIAIHILLPQSVDECDLIVRISAENRAGVSSPTDSPVGCRTTSTVPSTATTPTANSTGATTSTDPVDQNQEGDNTIIYAIAIPVGAVVIVATGVTVLLLIILWRCKRKTKAVEPPGEKKSPSEDKRERTTKVKSPEDNIYSKSPSLGEQPVYQPPVNSADARPQQLMYARIDPEKHSRPQPPASDNKEVQYSQIQHQEQL